MDLLIHTSKIKTDILKPCVYLSLNCFIPYFGQWVYIFSKETLERAFHIEESPSGSIEMNQKYREREFFYRSYPLGVEFRIYREIDVERFSLGVLNTFSGMKGIMETRFMEKVIDHMKLDMEK